MNIAVSASALEANRVPRGFPGPEKPSEPAHVNGVAPPFHAWS